MKKTFFLVSFTVIFNITQQAYAQWGRAFRRAASVTRHIETPKSSATRKAFGDYTVGDVDRMNKPRTNTTPTKTQREFRKAESEYNHNGRLIDEDNGNVLVDGKKHKSGVRPPDNEAQIDHVYPKSKGGDGTLNNLQLKGRKDNISKSNKTSNEKSKPANEVAF
jgi:hypothetical protein